MVKEISECKETQNYLYMKETQPSLLPLENFHLPCELRLFRTSVLSSLVMRTGIFVISPFYLSKPKKSTGTIAKQICLHLLSTKQLFFTLALLIEDFILALYYQHLTESL